MSADQMDFNFNRWRLMNESEVFAHIRSLYRSAKVVATADGPQDLESLVVFLTDGLIVNVMTGFKDPKTRFETIAQMALYLQPFQIIMIDETYHVHIEREEGQTDPPVGPPRGSLQKRFEEGDPAVSESISSTSVWGIPPVVWMVNQGFHYEHGVVVFHDESPLSEALGGGFPQMLTEAFNLSMESIRRESISLADKRYMLTLHSEACPDLFIRSSVLT